jgi:uncharacterized membrane protein YoaK (UPF0700 family)
MTGIRTRSESVAIALLLATVGGFLDAYTFVGHQVFANAQTGNVVLFGVESASRHWREAMLHLIPIGGFLVGIAVAETLGRPRVRQWLRRPLRVALGAEIVILGVLATLPDSTPELIITVPIAFAAAIQFATFRILVDTPYSTLFATGNLRMLAVSAYQWIADRDIAGRQHAGRFAAVVGAFVVGAVLGAICTNHFGTAAAAVAGGLLLVTLGALIHETRQLEREARGDDSGGE